MSGMLSTKPIKVDRLALIARLEEALKKGGGDYKKRKAAYERGLAKAVAELNAHLVKPITLEEAKTRSYGGYKLEVTVYSKTKVPEKPRDRMCDLRNTIAVLKLSNEPTVSLSAQQYQQHFPCEVESD